MIVFRKAVLFIHGFAGGIYDEEKLANFLEKNKKLDVYMFTLPGHKKRSFKSISYQEWIDASEIQIKKLVNYGYKDIYLVGHSMGGVIATFLATKYPQVKKVVLAAPAFDYTVSKDNNTISKVKNGVVALKNNNVDEVINRFLKLPLSSLKEFSLLVEKYKNVYLDLNIPTMILHGKSDTLVPLKSSNKIYKSLKNKKSEFIILDGITHDIFNEIDENDFLKIEKFLLK